MLFAGFSSHARLILLLSISIVAASCGTSHRTTSSREKSPSTLPGKSPSLKNSDSGGNAENISSSKTLQHKYAVLLGVPSSEISNLSLYRFIEDWLHTPYQYAGTSKKGVDCSGFASLLFLEVFEKSLSGSSAGICNACQQVDANNLKEGDLVFFKINSKEVSHMGVYLANNKFVHATTRAGVIISDLNEAYYKKYFFMGGRLK